MTKRIVIILIGVMLVSLPALAIFKIDSYSFKQFFDSEKCTDAIEKLKLCVEGSKFVFNTGEPIKINLTWVNLSDSERFIGLRSSGYKVIVVNEEGERLIPVYQQRYLAMQERSKANDDSATTVENNEEFLLYVRGGGDRGINTEANKSDSDIADLTGRYDYNLKKGKYHVSISRRVPSRAGESPIEFVIKDIEIEVK